MDEIYVVIDIGTSKVSTLIGKINGLGQVDVLGKGSETCIGVKKGNIVDIECTSSSIKSSVIQSEEMSGLRVKSAFVNISGMHLSLINTKKWTEISSERREITKEDIESVKDKVRQVEIPQGNYLIDIIPRGYMVDTYDDVIDPLGMEAAALGIEADVILASTTSVHNIMKSMEKVGIKIEGLIVESLAVGNMFLTLDEKQMGVLLIDIGGEITNIALLNNNRLHFVGALPVGGEHITNDIAIGLKIPFAEAEKFKKQYNLALTSLIKFDQEEIVVDISGISKKNVKVSEVVEIIEARVNEIFSLCVHMVNDLEINQDSFSSIVLTGRGISCFYGAIELAGEVFSTPVRIASLKSGTGIKPEYTTCAAMIMYASSSGRNLGMVVEKSNDSKKKSKIKGKNFLEKVIDFFRKLF